MKYLLVMLSLLLFPTLLKAQEANMSTISSEICDCLNEPDTDFLKSTEEINALAEQCMMQAVLTNVDFLTKGIDIEAISSEEMEKFMQQKGIEIATYTAQRCPKFAELAMKTTESSISDNRTYTIGGAFTSIEEEGAFILLTLQENDGRKHKLFWMEHFEGAGKLMQESKEKCIGVPVKLQYKEIESYSAKLKDYTKIKVITTINWQ